MLFEKLCHLTTFHFRLVLFISEHRTENKRTRYQCIIHYRHFRHWKILSCHDLGYQMSIFKKNTCPGFKPSPSKKLIICSLLFLDKYFLRNRAIWLRFIFDWYFLSRKPGTKIKESGTSSTFVFVHLLHNISFGR
jgi:hypothetical protein